MITIRCSKCKKDKDESLFNRSKNGKHGRCHECQECSTERYRSMRAARRSRNQEEVLEAQRRLHPTGKKPCRVCKVIKPLSDFYVHRVENDGRSRTCKTCNDRKVTELLTGRRDVLIKKIQDEYSIEGCFKCGTLDKIEIDHVMPLSKGGADEFDNYQLLCRGCNASKSATYADYRPSAKTVGLIE